MLIYDEQLYHDDFISNNINDLLIQFVSVHWLSNMTSTLTKSKTGKQIACKVRMLDDQELPFHIDVSLWSI